jgi:hypothetical protein
MSAISVPQFIQHDYPSSLNKPQPHRAEVFYTVANGYIVVLAVKLSTYFVLTVRYSNLT